MQTATVLMGLVAWWGSACRVGQMHPRTHRLVVLLWHVCLGLLALACAGAAALRGSDMLPLFTAASLLAYLMATLHEWASGPPWWALRQGGR